MRSRIGWSSPLRATALVCASLVFASARIAHAEEPAPSPSAPGPSAPGPEEPTPSAKPSAAEAATAVAAAPASLEVKAPEPTRPLTAPYPRGAEGAAEVVLELLVSVNGEVLNPRVVEGREPFASSALAAIREITFTPAERGGVKVAARAFATKISFLPPIDAPHEIPPDPYVLEAPTFRRTPTRTGAPDEPAAEVEVLGKRAHRRQDEPRTSRDSRHAGSLRDGFRAIEALPGVVPMASGLPFFFVRGAPPGSAGYFVDGIRLPVLFHLGAGPSVVYPGLIDQIDFFPGSAPVAFGRTSGGIVSANTKEPPGRVHGKATCACSTPGCSWRHLCRKSGGAVLVAGRFGYPGLLLPLFAPNTKLSYWDYQDRLVLDFGKNDHVTVMVLGSYDYLVAKRVRAEIRPRFPIRSASVRTRTRASRHAPYSKPSSTDSTCATTKRPTPAASARPHVGLRPKRARPEGSLDRRHAPRAGGWKTTLQNARRARPVSTCSSRATEVEGEGGAPANAEFVKLFPKRDELSVGARAEPPMVPRRACEAHHGRALRSLRCLPDRRLFHRAFARSPSEDPRLQSSLAWRVVSGSSLGWCSSPRRGSRPSHRASCCPCLASRSGASPKVSERSVQTSHGIELTLPKAFTLTTTFFGSRTIGLADVFAACPGARTPSPTATRARRARAGKPTDSRCT